MKRFLFATIYISLLTIGCVDDIKSIDAADPDIQDTPKPGGEPPPPDYILENSPSFILSYYGMEVLQVIVESDNKLSMFIFGDMKAGYDKIYGNIKNEVLYNELCNYYGDTSYNKDIDYYIGEGYNESYICDIESINITAETDWDDSHPAGTLLNDLVKINGHSYFGFIKNGYADYLDQMFEYTLTDINKNGIYCLAYGVGLGIQFSSLPDNRPVKLHLSVKTSNGDLLTSDINY